MHTVPDSRRGAAKKEGKGRKKRARAQATVRPRQMDSTLTVEPCEHHFLCIRVAGGLACTSFPCDEKSLKLHRRSLEMKLCFSMTHTYALELCVWRASVNPAPCPRRPPPSAEPRNYPCAAVGFASRCLLLLAAAASRWVPLQRPGYRPFRHVSVIEGRNLARLHRSSAWARSPLASSAHTHIRTCTGARGTAYFFSLCYV